MKKDMISTAVSLQTAQAERAASLARDTARLALSGPGPEVYAEAAALAQATARRMQDLQAGWLRDWGDWIDYSGSISGADTVSKYLDRSGNIVLRAHALALSQMTDVTGLIDNVAVSYGYWINQQTDPGDT